MNESEKARAKRRRMRLCLIIVAPVVVGACVVLWLAGVFGRPGYGPLVMTHDGPSDALERTLIVPTLDTPVAEGKNVIWCASFQIAWNRLKDDIIKGPIRLKDAEEAAERLNNAKQSEADLPPDSYYAAAGWVDDGIVQKIQEDMARQFPSVPTPTFDRRDVLLVAYAYLAANVKFTIPFFENRKEFVFKDSSGKTIPVSSFGIRQEDHDAYLKLREQVEVLYISCGDNVSEPDEFVVDLCKDSDPNQIVLACVPLRDTLAETLSDIEAKTGSWEGHPGEHEFGPTDVLLVPNMFWRLEHHFAELEGREILRALQMIEFRLDRSGAELASEAKVMYKCMSRLFISDRPFVICMKKRGAQHPFFVMWVDNAELLSQQ